MALRTRTLRWIGMSVSAFVFVIGLLAAWWLGIIPGHREAGSSAAAATTERAQFLDIRSAWREGRALLDAGDLAGARRVAEAVVEADPQAIEGHRLLVEWSFAAMGRAREAAAFEDAVDISLTQADWLGTRGKAVAESELIRACCANARAVHLERTGAAAHQAAGHLDRARLHAQAALAADPALEAAKDLVRRLGPI